MITVRRSNERGHANHGWLDTYHTFSFAEYHDPQHMGFRSLRVINEDRVAGGRGFDTHPHRDMEIITYVLSGALQHRDSMGTSSTIKPGEVQYMCAGTGVRHSEYNASPDEEVYLMQIWILPDKRGYQPSYDQRAFQIAENKNRFVLVVSRDGREQSIAIHQDVALSIAQLNKDAELSYALSAGRAAWLQVARGAVLLNDVELQQGDGAQIEDLQQLSFVARQEAELLLFDLT